MKVKNTLKFLLSISLFVSLSGCSMFYGDHRTHYPKATFETCYKNPQIQRDEDAGLERLGLFGLGEKEVLEGPNNNLHIGYVSGMTQLQNAIQALKAGNFGPINALYRNITPKALSNFMIACNKLTAHSANTALTSIGQQYLNTTPAPPPTLFLTKPRSGTCSIQYQKSHLKTMKAFTYAVLMYETKSLHNPTMSEVAQASQQAAQLVQITKKVSPQVLPQVTRAFLNESPSNPATLRIVKRAINYQNAVSEAENGNWTNMIAIFQQIQSPQWRHFFVSCDQMYQKYHLKAQLINTN